METFIAVVVDGEYKHVLLIQADTLTEAEYKLTNKGWDGWASLKPVEYDSDGICLAINSLT